MTKKPALFSVPRITHPKYPGITIRIGQSHQGSGLHVFRWIDGKQRSVSLKKSVTDLGTTRKEQEKEARRLGCLFIEELGSRPESSSMPAPSSGPLTLSALAETYEENAFEGRTASYKRDAVASLKRIQSHLGDLAIADFTPSAVQKYMEHRKKEGHAPAGRSDLVALSIAINWAIGEKMLTANPLTDKNVKAKMKLNRKPARAVADKDRYAKLMAKADQQPPAFGVLLAVAWHTGHRISAILGLRWQDVTFKKTKDAPNGSITWYAGATEDNKKHEHTLPMNKEASAALKTWQKETGGIGAQWVFASETDPSKALERHTTKKWLRSAERLAKLEHLKHGGWHAFRRGWATARKHFPLKDVAAAGGWNDTQSVIECYQHADKETTKQVVLQVV